MITLYNHKSLNPIETEDTLRAITLLRVVENEYFELPKEKQTAGVCGCGRPVLREAVLKKMRTVGEEWVGLLERGVTLAGGLAVVKEEVVDGV